MRDTAMNLLFSCIGKRGYIADFFREHLSSGNRIVGTSNTPWTPGFCHCDKSYVLPDIASQAYIPAVKEVCHREAITAIFSFFDPDVALLSQHRQEFLDIGVLPVMPLADVADMCFDKLKTFHFLQKHDLKTARTYASLKDAVEALQRRDIEYPLYVKPRSGFGSRSTLLARNDCELEAFFQIEEQMLIQECLTGTAFDFDLLCDLEGNVISVVVWEKMLSRQGETERAVTRRIPQLIEFGVHLGTLVGNVGPLDVDLFVQDGQIYVLELNPRFGGGYPVSHLAGADFPRYLLQMIRGEKVIPDIGCYDDGVAMMKDLRIVGGAKTCLFHDLGVDSSLADDCEDTQS